MDKPPEVGDLPIDRNIAYVLVQPDLAQTLAMCMDDLHLSESVATCSLEQLVAITHMTGHNFLAEKSTVPLSLQSEINKLYDLALNPTKNINATENIGTCIATRKSRLMSTMSGHEKLLSEISLSGTRKQSLIEEAKQHFETAKADLAHALDTNAYTEGHDTLNLNTRLLSALNVQLNILSLSDLDIIKGLTPAEIVAVCAEPALRLQIVTQLGTLENLVIFIMDLPPQKLTAFLQATREGLLREFIKTPDDLGALLIGLDIEKCVMVFDVMKGDIIKAYYELNNVFRYLTPEQCTSVFNAMKDKLPAIIQSGEDFGVMLTFLTPEQRKTLTSIKRLMSSLDNAASDMDTRAFAAALMSDNPERIKADFKHFIEKTRSPAKLISALSVIEPRWLEKINSAAGLKLTGAQLTSRPDIEIGIKLYITQFLDNKKTVFQQYKQVVKSVATNNTVPLRPSDYKKIVEERWSKANDNSSKTLDDKRGPSTSS